MNAENIAVGFVVISVVVVSLVIGAMIERAEREGREKREADFYKSVEGTIQGLIADLKGGNAA